MKQIVTRLPQLVAVLAFIAAVALVYGQTATCDNDYPLCSETITTLQDTDCGNGGHWEIGPIISFYYYACNNWYDGCGGTHSSGTCNVMVRYSGKGRMITCTSTSQQFACLTEPPTSSVNLTRNCAGGPCAVPGGTNDTPHGYPGPDEAFLDEGTPHPPLPAPNQIPN